MKKMKHIISCKISGSSHDTGAGRYFFVEYYDSTAIK